MIDFIGRGRLTKNQLRLISRKKPDCKPNPTWGISDASRSSTDNCYAHGLPRLSSPTSGLRKFKEYVHIRATPVSWGSRLIYDVVAQNIHHMEALQHHTGKSWKEFNPFRLPYVKRLWRVSKSSSTQGPSYWPWAEHRITRCWDLVGSNIRPSGEKNGLSDINLE